MRIDSYQFDLSQNEEMDRDILLPPFPKIFTGVEVGGRGAVKDFRLEKGIEPMFPLLKWLDVGMSTGFGKDSNRTGWRSFFDRLFEQVSSWLGWLDKPSTLAGEESPESLTHNVETFSSEPIPLTATVIEPRFGRLTFDAEGSEGGPFHSRIPHVPGKGIGVGKNSGVTIGRGYDMRWRTGEQIVTQLTAAGMSLEDAEVYRPAAGLFGESAQSFLTLTPNLPSISLEEQKSLFELTYADYEAEAERLATKADVAEKYGNVSWNVLDPRIKEVLVDLTYRGDYTASARGKIQKAVVENDLSAFIALMMKRSNWSSVPGDRFYRRVNFLTSE